MDADLLQRFNPEAWPYFSSIRPAKECASTILFGNNHAFGLDKFGIENHPLECLFLLTFGEHDNARLEILKTFFPFNNCVFEHVPLCHFSGVYFFVCPHAALSGKTKTLTWDMVAFFT